MPIINSLKQWFKATFQNKKALSGLANSPDLYTFFHVLAKLITNLNAPYQVI
jgi:hypothetical protein